MWAVFFMLTFLLLRHTSSTWFSRLMRRLSILILHSLIGDSRFSFPIGLSNTSAAQPLRILFLYKLIFEEIRSLFGLNWYKAYQLERSFCILVQVDTRLYLNLLLVNKQMFLFSGILNNIYCFITNKSLKCMISIG